MQLYKCLVRCGGLITHEVPKYNIPREEIMLLRHIHGSDAIVRIYKTKVVPDVSHDAIVRGMAKYYALIFIAATFPSADLAGLEMGLDDIQDEEIELGIEAVLEETRSTDISAPVKENALSGMASGEPGEYRPE